MDHGHVVAAMQDADVPIAVRARTAEDIDGHPDHWTGKPELPELQQAMAISGGVAGGGPLQAMPTVSITVMARTTISPVACMGLDLPT